MNRRSSFDRLPQLAFCAILAAAVAVTGAQAAQVTLNPSQDNTIYQNNGAVSCGVGAHIIAGRTDGGSLRRALLQFDIAGNIPAGSTINTVSLILVVNRERDNQARNMSLHRLTQSWGEAGSNCDGAEGQGAPAQTGDATWVYRMFNSSAWTPAQGGTFNPTASSTRLLADGNGSRTWTGGTLVADVQSMLNSPGANFGWILRGAEGVNKTARRFYSTNEGQTARRPALIVNFTPPAGAVACCTTVGFCTLEDPAVCAGTVLPSVTTCAPNPCPQPQGACCSALGTCAVIGQADCETQGDTFQGTGTTCTPNPCSGGGLAKFVDPLPIPALAVPASGTQGGTATYNLNVTEFQQQLHRDLPPTTVWGYGGTYPGPTILASRNEPVTVNWGNDLRDLATGALRTSHYLTVDTCPHGPDAWKDSPRIVTHMHGAHVPARYDGYPEAAYPPGQSATYVYPNHQLPGTLWYHDHSLGITRLNVYMGMAGFYLLTDEYEKSLNLPSGPFEVGLAIQDRSFNPDGTWSYPDTVKQNFFGDTILVNGKVWPYLEVTPGKYRFRLLEGSNSRTYTLSLSTADPFWIIGNELGLLQEPVPVTQLTYGPGERYDAIFDFSPYPPGTEIILQNSAPIKFPNTVNPTEGVIPDIMKFIVVAGPAHTDPIPAFLRPFDVIPEAEAVATRDLTLARDPNGCGGGEWLINGMHWDDITEIPDLGSTEVWNWINDTDIMHPMHMHLVAFQILDRFALDPNGVPTGPALPLAPYEKGPKDTAMAHARTVTRVIARFEDYMGKYAYHCHILEHEDHEMMRQFRTVSSVCDTDGVCEPGEDCIGCADCAALSGAVCGNDLCEAGNGEDCVSCPADCNGKQNGSVSSQYCCGDGDGTNPVDCSDSRCSTGGWFCRSTTRPNACCGDFMCEGSETASNCNPDCSPDTDADGFYEYADCDEGNPLAGAVPGAVPGLVMQDLGAGTYRLYWDSLSYAAGGGTVYDVFSGLAADLNADGGLQRGTCLSDDVPATQYLDPTGVPPLGGIRYYVVRGQNACPGGTGTFGDANRDTSHGAATGGCS